jgi:hypothetical protein
VSTPPPEHPDRRGLGRFAAILELVGVHGFWERFCGRMSPCSIAHN